ncbi:MAG: 16S rRNA (cytosine(967)-C(5))-methyltransferase RsmB [Syntrophomonadaceae bacterium]|nr:16S rRNA (cytosine(967)-C(5))-methyltransferase RsmB [Syntrophomonadaceae bacterium]
MTSDKEIQPKDPSGKRSVREVALLILHQINQQGAYANLALDKSLQRSSLPLHDRNLVTELVNGTVRMQKHLDWVLALFLQGSLEKQNPWFLNILRLSAYQLLFMDHIPAYACINEAVDLTRQRVNSSMARVVNGVLRNLLRQKDILAYPPSHEPAYLATYYSHPDWVIEYYLREYGWDKTKSILEYNNQRPGLDFRCNQLKISPADLVHRLQSEGVSSSISPLMPGAINIRSLSVPLSGLKAYQQGLFYVQNLASMLAGPILDPQPGEKIIDLCAGVGGKSTHLAEMMNNQGTVLAFDLYPKKLELLAQNAERLGITIIHTEAADATQLNYDEEVADRVLLDAPCTGLGVLNRRSDARWQKRPEDLPTLLALQKALLDQAARMVKRGGVILYSTCSILRQENQEQVEAFLQRHQDFQLESISDQLHDFPLRTEDREKAKQGMLLLIPGSYGTDGMFYALLRRVTG